MENTVPLDVLPNGLQFPAELQPRVHYDFERRALCFRGFMSKSEFDRLSRLHNDYLYQRSLEKLFQKCTFQAEPEPRFPALTAVVGSLAVLVCGVLAFGLLRLYY